MKRLWMMLVALVAVANAGCGGGDGGSKPLRFWQFWDTALIEPIVAEFERQNPGIDVEVEQLTWKSGLEKIQAAVASGTQPDLCELGSTWLPRFSYEGVLADVSATYAALGDEFIMWGSGRWEGGMYGLPWVQGSRALFYNRSLFERAGLDPDEPPQTWDELLDAARRIDALGDDIHGFGLNLGERYILYKKFMAFAWGNGGDILDDNGSVVFDSDANLQALEFYQRLAQYSLKEKQEVLDHDFKSGRLGMQISGAWNLRNYARDAPDLDYGLVLVPKPDDTRGEHASFAGAEMLVIFKASKRADDALKLARFLQSYEQAKKVSLEVRSVFPASRDILKDPAFMDDPRVRVFVEQSLTSRTAPAHPAWIDMEDVINRAVEEVLYGRAEPKASLASAAKQLEDVMAKFDRTSRE